MHFTLVGRLSVVVLEVLRWYLSTNFKHL